MSRGLRRHSGLAVACAAIGVLSLCVPLCRAAVPVRVEQGAAPREQYAAELLRKAAAQAQPPVSGAEIILGVRGAAIFGNAALDQFWPGASEAYLLRRIGNRWYVEGSDASGVLYGSMELAGRIGKDKALPAEIDYEDHPSMKLRGASIGMQKMQITYQGAEYDYRYTPENFPFFYNKAMWIRYLDMLAANRMNALYLWNGHPFTSLLKLPKYPEAQEVPTAQLDENIAMFHWLVREADRRGIWVVQGFYNIHLSHTFAQAHGLHFHLRRPTPLAGEYTRYVISQFIKEYPNVGLLITLGEALAPDEGAEWLSKAILPGVQDGMRERGMTSEPPVIVRAHATEIEKVLDAALPIYKNIDVMEKWNGESLTWNRVRGRTLARDKDLSNRANVDIANIHILANLEPFRWGDPDFIRECVLSFQKIGIRGVHVYPLRFWDWPYSGDKTSPRLLQMDRDWIWYAAWGRYAWNPNRDPKTEHEYWARRIGKQFGSLQAGEKLLEAYELSGVCAPELLPRIGITDGNREAFSLGLTMPELIDPRRFGAVTQLWTDFAPPGERLDAYAQREWRHEPHRGATPLGVAADAEASSAKAVEAAEAAGPFVTRDREEYRRLLDDMRSIHLLMRYYNQKTRAAALTLRFGYSHDPGDLERAEPLLAASVDTYRKLTQLADRNYMTAASLETSHRTIPFTAGPDRFNRWSDCLPEYERELRIFRSRLAWLQHSRRSVADGTAAQVRFQILGGEGEDFQLEKGQRLLTDGDGEVQAVAPPLNGLAGYRIGERKAAESGTKIEIRLEQPADALVGFWKTESRHRPAANVPEGWELRMLNGVTASAQPGSLAVWSRSLPAGNTTLDFGRGGFVVLGFVQPEATLGPPIAFDAVDAAPGRPADFLDWLFEN